MTPLAQYLDFANHKADATPDDIQKLCANVLTYNFHAAFVNPVYVTLAKQILQTNANVGTVISFPLGADTTGIKQAAANNAVTQGVDELDVVPNIGLFFAGDMAGFLKDMSDVVESARIFGRPVIVKFILEPGLFDTLPDRKEKLMQAANYVQQAGADFVKIGSGMGPRGPSVEDVSIVRQAVGKNMKLKVAGGITTREIAERFIATGVDRIGTSHAVEILNDK
jgi:deoxyribose-phosphate aldolase